MGESGGNITMGGYVCQHAHKKPMRYNQRWRMNVKILVLNNDIMERTVIQQVLQVNGHEIVAAENSDTAMLLLQ